MSDVIGSSAPTSNSSASTNTLIGNPDAASAMASIVCPELETPAAAWSVAPLGPNRHRGQVNAAGRPYAAPDVRYWANNGQYAVFGQLRFVRL